MLPLQFLIKVILKFSVSFAALVSISLGCIASENYPSLTDVIIGEKFNHPNASTSMIHKNSPSTQYKVPNYGPTIKIFPEYQVTLLNTTRAVVIVSANAAMRDLKSCEEKLKIVAIWAENIFPNHTLRNDNIESDKDTYYDNDNKNNDYYSLTCLKPYGPFWDLEYQVRNKLQDNELKKELTILFENEESY